MATPDLEIKNVTKESMEIQKALNVFREKQKNRESIDEAAVEFVTKADLVIQRAEKNEIFLTDDQKRRIRSNLLKIRASLESILNLQSDP
ncbi:hypothetical protein IQB76_01620 [Leptospira borgpetersenii serovar Hardjo-bovis]|uniref:Uncharacterized protein n=1 Tax=Leptospira borgpetersenii serovar Hardjo-bovis str. Sponselee TaxID=1303729 RepID=M6C1K1_LEPBO|nr:hypothetical protein [Leptospira borgpetersenii]ABJ79828.1 Hypothetical protein LBL_2447 [Leptospira borgpetersenii serovar Hardjo-bovis str. L550]AMX59227.1 hypothetical protein LBK6_13065 [Leptospira borgpetersenii serovar Hardjo]AMX62456.1 hypothetical protein LBK9_12975 [Leptospira borgpetersenii serovar Hardjo]AMX65698.1 hypothetical protein LBK30_12990 [Leptospira borgpetersenii serovar Hardjo]AMX68931.1 hypothetical protein LBHA_12945 [Leptospira borgpetersenii serovar Hardjo]